jgi:hypothetical protein
MRVMPRSSHLGWYSLVTASTALRTARAQHSDG